jgi:hypothetical protein
MPIRISIRVTVPNEILNATAVRNAIIRAQQTNTAPGIKHLFEQTVDGWQNKPDFLQHQEITSDRIAIQVYAGGQYADQYRLVNSGSPPHMIPSQPGFLRFQTGYRSATRPRIIASRAYTRYGPFRTAFQVHHPGFEAREFDDVIGETYYPTFQQEMQDAINSATHNP